MSVAWMVAAVLGVLVLVGVLVLGWMLLCAEPLPTPDLSRRGEDRCTPGVES